MFRACKRSYYLQHILGLEVIYPEGVRNPGTADTGTLMHYGLELHYRLELPCDDLTLRRLLVAEAVKQAEAPHERDLPAAWQKTIDMALAMIRSYVAWTAREGSDEGLLVLDTEHEFSWDVPGHFGRDEYTGGEYTFTLTGHADILMLDTLTDRHLVGDHKSVAQMNQMPRKNNFQARTYGLLWYKEDGTVAEGAFHNMVKRNMRTGRAKGEQEHRAPITLGLEVIEHHEAQVLDLLQQIADFHVYYDYTGQTDTAQDNPNGECSWKCKGYELCERMDVPSFDWREHAEVNYITNTNGLKDLSTDTSIPGIVHA